MSAELGLNLDSTITTAIKARIEAEVVRAMSGDEVLGAYVTAALQQPVRVPNQWGSYDSKTQPFLAHVLSQAIREATQVAVAKFVAEEVGSIETEVRKALKRDMAAIATTLTNSLVTAADKTYGVSVALELKMPSKD